MQQLKQESQLFYFEVGGDDMLYKNIASSKD